MKFKIKIGGKGEKCYELIRLCTLSANFEKCSLIYIYTYFYYYNRIVGRRRRGFLILKSTIIVHDK